jgi:hypothetical protein
MRGRRNVRIAPYFAPPQALAHSLSEKLENFGYRFEFSYREEQHPELEDPDDYIRHSTLENLKVAETNIEGGALDVWGRSPSTIVNYALERLFYLNHLYQPQMWECYSTPGYYGEEIDYDVELVDSYLAQQLDVEALKLINYAPEAVMEYILKLEYKTDFRGRCWGIEKVPKAALVVSKQRLDNLLPEISAVYEEYGRRDLKMPLGVALFENDKFELIDGYHRLATALTGKKRVFNLIVGRAVSNPSAQAQPYRRGRLSPLAKA